MITVITRLYENEASAQGIVGRLYRAGFPRNAIMMITPNDNVARRMELALIPEDAAGKLATRIEEGKSLVVVHATYKPLNAVRIANETFETSGAISSGLENESFRVKAPRDHAPSVLKDHPHFLTMEGSVKAGPTISETLGLRLLSPQKRRSSAMSGGKLFFGDGVIRGRTPKARLKTGSFMSKMFWPMPLLSKKKESRSVLPGGGHPFSRLMGWPTISQD